MNSIIIYYFSGTGNTILVVEKLLEIFLKNNIKVETLKIENSNPEEIDTKETIGLAFPVAMQSTYPFIWDFINRLPKVNGTEIFMIDTLHAFSGAIVAPLKKVLIKKGYKPIGAKEVIMPSNIRNKVNPVKDKKVIKKGLKLTEDYVYSLINKNAKWGNIPIFPHIFYYLVSRNFLWNFIRKLGSKFKINHNKCTRCRICIEICPVKNIVMSDFTEHKDKCQLCMRCVMFCPTEAIKIPFVKIQRYTSVNIDKIKKVSLSN